MIWCSWLNDSADLFIYTFTSLAIMCLNRLACVGDAVMHYWDSHFNPRHSFPQYLRELTADSFNPSPSLDIVLSLRELTCPSLYTPCLKVACTQWLMSWASLPQCGTTLKDYFSPWSPHGISWDLCCFYITVHSCLLFNLSFFTSLQIFLRPIKSWSKAPLQSFL